MKKALGLPAKITPPHTYAVFPRIRLFSTLDDVQNASCIWISGPPGAGKTTLVTSYLEHRKPSTLWYQVDEGDSDLANLFYYLNLAAQKVSRRHKKLPLLTLESAGGLSAFTRRYFEKLYSSLDAPFFLVFDDYHILSRDAAFHETIVDAVETLPEGGILMILSRQQPPAAFARLRTNSNLISAINWEHLRLNNEEVRAIVRMHGNHQPTDSTVQQLETNSGGWVTGLILMLQDPGVKLPIEQSLGDRSPGVMFDYFAQEIFDRQDQQTREFLMQAALLPKTTARMAQNLTGNNEAERILRGLNRRNCFTEKHRQPTGSYYFHPLFRNFLLTQLMQSYSLKQLALLQCKAAKLLDANHQVESAITLFSAAGEWDEAARIICKCVPDLIDHGRYRTVQKWIDSLPHEIIDRTPYLLYHLGHSVQKLDSKSACGHFETAYQYFRQTDDAAGLLLTWSAIINSYLVEWSDFAPINNWVEIGEQLWKEHPEFPSLEIEIRFLSSLCFAWMYRRPEHPELPVLARQVHRLIEISPKTDFTLLAGISLMTYYGRLGEVAKCSLLFSTLKGAASVIDAPESWIIHVYLLEAIYTVISADPEKGLRAVDAGLALCDNSGTYPFEGRLKTIGTMLALQKGDVKAARAYIHSFGAMTASTQPLYLIYYHWLLAWVAWKEGSLAESREHLDFCLTSANQAGVPFAAGITHSAHAIVQFDSGNLSEGRVQLKAAFRIARIKRSARLKHHSLLLEAGFELQENNEQACLDALRRAFALGRKQDLFVTDWWNPVRMSHLCAKALENGIETDHVRTVIRKMQLVPDRSIWLLEQWPWAVKLYALGEFSLICDGDVVCPTAKGGKRVIELLKALVAFGGHAVSTVHLADALWSDADADAANNSLKTTLHRLRKLLRHPEALEVVGGLVSLNPRCCWVDVWAFGQLLSGGNNDASEPEQLEKLIALYRGPLLSTDIELAWVLAPREQLRHRFLKMVLALGQQLTAREEWQDAIKVYERGLEIEDVAEPLYRQLMRSYYQLGRHAEALTTYEHCRKMLAARLDIKPSQRTLALVRDIRSA